MKNLKPSQLPENTVIDDERYGEYIKRSGGLWEEMDRNNLGDRERVTDTGYDKNGSLTYAEWLRAYGLPSTEKSDDYFKNYRIVAVPPEFVFVGDAESLHGPWVERLRSYYDGSRSHDCKGYNCEES